MSLTRTFTTIFEYEQVALSDTWVIEHNLGVYPAIDVFVPFNGDNVKIIPLNITYDSPNQCTVTFSSPRSGFATVA